MKDHEKDAHVGPMGNGPRGGMRFAARRQGMRGRGMGPRRPGRGRDIQAAILALLSEGPHHGYQIITEIGERTGGAWEPSPGSVYPTLSNLEDQGLLVIEEKDGRRVASLTEEGKAYTLEHKERLEKAFDGAEREVDLLGRETCLLMGAVRHAGTASSQAQRQKLITLLAQTRSDIYKMLAEDER